VFCFVQAEDGIRDATVTGVQTCALPILAWESLGVTLAAWVVGLGLGIGILSWFNQSFIVPHGLLMNVFDWGLLLSHTLPIPLMRSEERRVGKECRDGLWSDGRTRRKNGS